MIKLWLIYVLIAHAKSANELIINNYWIQAPAIAQSKFGLNESVQTKNDIIFWLIFGLSESLSERLIHKVKRPIVYYIDLEWPLAKISRSRCNI